MSTERHPAAPGRGVRVAVIDSGVHASHPHVGGVAEGIAIDAFGDVSADYVDRIGHGTAVTAVIREKAPAAECYAVRIFDQRLSSTASTLIAAIDWAVQAGAHIINLSLGTSNPAHAALFAPVILRAIEAGAWIVAARDEEGVEYLPGSLPHVVPVQVDWACPRDEYRLSEIDGQAVVRASGFPRPVPGVDPRRNLSGVSFAVANVSAFLAVARSAMPEARTWQEALSELTTCAQGTNCSTPTSA